MPEFIPLWIGAIALVGAFAWLVILNNWTVDHVKKLRNRVFDIDRSLEHTSNAIQNLYAKIGTVEERVNDLESPPMLKDERENRTCPECNEEKEIRVDDYLCDECREPE